MKNVRKSTTKFNKTKLDGRCKIFNKNEKVACIKKS